MGPQFSLFIESDTSLLTPSLAQHFLMVRMATIVVYLVFHILIFINTNVEGGPPSPGYNPSSTINSITFSQAFHNLWGPQHQRLDQDTLTIWLDRTSGSGFKSFQSYRSGYFGAAIKLQPGYTAGVITSLYVSFFNLIYVYMYVCV